MNYRVWLTEKMTTCLVIRSKDNTALGGIEQQIVPSRHNTDEKS